MIIKIYLNVVNVICRCIYRFLINGILHALQTSYTQFFTWFNKGKWTLVMKTKPDRHVFLIPYFFNFITIFSKFNTKFNTETALRHKIVSCDVNSMICVFIIYFNWFVKQKVDSFENLHQCNLDCSFLG